MNINYATLPVAPSNDLNVLEQQLLASLLPESQHPAFSVAGAYRGYLMKAVEITLHAVIERNREKLRHLGRILNNVETTAVFPEVTKCELATVFRTVQTATDLLINKAGLESILSLSYTRPILQHLARAQTPQTAEQISLAVGIAPTTASRYLQTLYHETPWLMDGPPSAENDDLPRATYTLSEEGQKVIATS
jgi:hypothetical protein